MKIQIPNIPENPLTKKGILWWFIIPFIIFLFFSVLISNIHAQSIATPLFTKSTYSSTTNAGFKIGDSTNIPLLSESFQSNQKDIVIDTIVLPYSIYKQGSPTDTLILTIYNTTTTNPVSSSTIPIYASQSEATNKITVLYLNKPVLVYSTSTNYYIDIKRTSNYNPDNYYRTWASSYAPGLYMATDGANFYLNMTIYGSYSNTSINFLVPQNNNTGKDFNEWKLYVKNMSNITEENLNPFIQINYGADSSTLIYTDIKYIFSNNFDTFLTKSHNLDNGSWFAQSYIYDNSGLQYSSNIINFTVSSTAPSFESQINDYVAGNPNIFGSTFNTASATQETVANYGVIGNMIIKILNFLFKPGTFSTSLLTDSLEQFQTIFPFSIFFNFADTVEQATHQASSTYTLSLKLPMSESTTPVWYDGMLTEVAGATSTTLWFEVQTNAIWLITGILIISMII